MSSRNPTWLKLLFMPKFGKDSKSAAAAAVVAAKVLESRLPCRRLVSGER